MLHRRKLDGMRANIARLRARGEVRNKVQQLTAITAYSFCIALTGPLVHTSVQSRVYAHSTASAQYTALQSHTIVCSCTYSALSTLAT
jgi:hypothetical protein